MAQFEGIAETIRALEFEEDRQRKMKLVEEIIKYDQIYGLIDEHRAAFEYLLGEFHANEETTAYIESLKHDRKC